MIGPHVFGMGIGELLVVLVVVLVVFGPGRLPEVMGSLGKGMQEFKKGLREPPEIEKMPEKTLPPRRQDGKASGEMPRALLLRVSPGRSSLHTSLS
jgi:sec-independent protein translocase protein TatA